MKPARDIAVAGMAGALAFAAVAPAFAQVPPGCAELCAVSCIKPISIPDRWDDATAIAGYTGGGKRSPNWRNNGQYDSEKFTDTNGNRLHDVGEAFIDGNANGIYDAEGYDPATTGYNADPNPANLLAPQGDLGLEFTLHPGSPGTAAVPGQYYAIDLPPINRGTPVTGGFQYRDNFSNCNPSMVGRGDRLMTEPGSMLGPTNQAMRDLVAQDPNAYWDATSSSLQGSAFPADQSPRILRFSRDDPRMPPTSGNNAVVVTGVLAFFLEQVVGNAECLGRLLRTSGTGDACASGATNGGFVFTCASPAAKTTWGRMKGAYR